MVSDELILPKSLWVKSFLPTWEKKEEEKKKKSFLDHLLHLWSFRWTYKNQSPFFFGYKCKSFMSSIGDIETYKRRGRKTVRVKDMSTIGASAGIHTFLPAAPGSRPRCYRSVNPSDLYPSDFLIQSLPSVPQYALRFSYIFEQHNHRQ